MNSLKPGLTLYVWVHRSAYNIINFQLPPTVTGGYPVYEEEQQGRADKSQGQAIKLKITNLKNVNNA